MYLAQLQYYWDIIGLSNSPGVNTLSLTTCRVIHTIPHPSFRDVKDELPNRWGQKQLLEEESSTQQSQSVN